MIQEKTRSVRRWSDFEVGEMRIMTKKVLDEEAESFSKNIGDGIIAQCFVQSFGRPGTGLGFQHIVKVTSAQGRQSAVAVYLVSTVYSPGDYVLYVKAYEKDFLDRNYYLDRETSQRIEFSLGYKDLKGTSAVLETVMEKLSASVFSAMVELHQWQVQQDANTRRKGFLGIFGRR